MASMSAASASVTTSASRPSITARACAPEPPCEARTSTVSPVFAFQSRGEGLVDLAIELARRIVGDVEQFRSARGRAPRDGERRGRRDEADAEAAQRARRRLRLELREQARNRLCVAARDAPGRCGIGVEGRGRGRPYRRVSRSMRMKLAGLALRAVGIEGERAVERQHDRADVVGAQARAPARRGRCRGRCARGSPRRSAETVAVPSLSEKDRAGARAARPAIQNTRASSHSATAGVAPAAAIDVAAGRVEGVGQDERDRLSGLRRAQVAVEGGDARDRRCRGRKAARGPGRRRARRRWRQARKGRGTPVGPVHPLHRHPERQRRGAAAGLGAARDIAAASGRRTRAPPIAGSTTLSPLSAESGMPTTVVEAEIGGEGLELRHDRPVALLRPADEVHLVDRQHDLADAEHGNEERVAPRLPRQALAGVDEEHGEIRGRGAGRHVARILLVAGRVGDDEGARARREEAVGDIDGDALLALRRKPVDEEREVERRRSCRAGARPLEGRDLVVEELFRVVQQAADQGRLAVVDGAAGNEAQHVLVALLLRGTSRSPRGGSRTQRGDHQK